jgi:DNA-binding CsgD family transcriptional regulator
MRYPNNELLKTQVGYKLGYIPDLSEQLSDETLVKYYDILALLAGHKVPLNAVYGLVDMSTCSFKYIQHTAIEEIMLGGQSGEFTKSKLSECDYFQGKPNNSSYLGSSFQMLIDIIHQKKEDKRRSFVAYTYSTNYLDEMSNKPILSQISGLEFDSRGYPLLCFFKSQDISYLTKNSKHCGIRVEFDGGDDVVICCLPDPQIKKQDIFTERELSVLKLLCQGAESKQIAETLFISSNTVDNHRKNMIRKLDARDTTALVQLSKMLGVLR